MWLFTIFCAILLSGVANGANILCVFMTPSYSHQIVFQPIWRELSIRGHKVTVYTPSPLKDRSLTNLTEHDLSFSFAHLNDLKAGEAALSNIFDIYWKLAEGQLSHPSMQALLNNTNKDQYDLLLVEYYWPSYYAFKENYNVPMIGVVSMALNVKSADAIGIEKHPILDPDFSLPFSYAENFKERVQSWAHNWKIRLQYKFEFSRKIETQIKQFFGDIKKGAYELAGEVSLVIGNYNLAAQNIKPVTPTFIPISGIHVQPQKPLPLDLSEVLDNLNTDAIYFSLGTNVEPSKLILQRLSKILNVLGGMPYKIIWKNDSENLPKNISTNFYVRKWFPQQDVLGHPKVKLFITQGGIQSFDEALSRMIPMLIIPFHGDQKMNADRGVRLGIAESLDFDSFTEEEMNEKLRKLLSDPKYKSNIEKLSKIANDQPMSALDTAVFWIEYVLRHDGAKHLRYPAVDLPFYQYYFLDIYFFVASIVTLVLYLSWKILMLLLLSAKFIHTRVFQTIKKSKTS